ncbi:ABC transporter substrate-binding protein [Jatrophihabitans sp. YIM 134969]
MVDGRTRVTWWLGRGPAADRFQELFVDPFNDRQPAVHLAVHALGHDARNRTVEALERGDGPDLVMVPRGGDFVDLARRRLLADLTGYARTHGWTTRLMAPATRLATVGGALFGLPRSAETMFLLTHQGVARPPMTFSDLETAADDALSDGVLPFGAGCADFPESCELLWTLVVNHIAGPAAVRAALRHELPWTSPAFVAAVEMLQRWFQQGWFGDGYFDRTIAEGLASVVDGRAAMAPAMTGMLPAPGSAVTPSPFPSRDPGRGVPLYVFGTASFIGVNAASPVPGHAVAVLDALFRPEVRRRFAAGEPGDWNIPLADPDAAAIERVAPPVFASPAVGLARAVAANHFGFASWSFLSPAAESVVVEQVPALAHGRLSARQHLEDLAAAHRSSPAPGVD